jgi:putative glycosyltransferase
VKLSIVATLYRSAPFIEEFWRRASESARSVAGDDYEIVLVNDGSPDESLALAIELTQRDPKLTVVDLSRNFGHHKAMMTGLARAEGERVFLIDSDLEELPEWLTDFTAQMDRERCDAVYGVQERRRGGWFDRLSGRIFYRVSRLLTGLDIKDDYTTARLMSRRYVDALLRHDEREIDIGSLCVITGFDQRAMPVTKLSASKTTYTLGRKLSLMLNAITSFSNLPLIGIFYLGITIFVVAGAFSTYFAIVWLFTDNPVSGWTSLIVSLWLLGGLTLCALGVIGIYLAKVFSEAKRRPYTIVREIHGKQRR